MKKFQNVKIQKRENCENEINDNKQYNIEVTQ